MIFTGTTLDYFSLIPHKVRSAMAQTQAIAPFAYEDEPFFAAYQALEKRQGNRMSQRAVAEELGLSRDRMRDLEGRFEQYGTIGLLPEVAHVDVDPNLERLVVLIKSARPHENASHALQLADALEIPGASLELIRHIQRCYGYGQNLNTDDVVYFSELQHIVDSVKRLTQKPIARVQGIGRQQFIDFEHDPMQQRVELFRTLSSCYKRRQLRPLLMQFGIHPNRYYELKARYLTFGIWGLVDRIQTTKKGEKISPELELNIIENRLIGPSLSTSKMIQALQLQCSKSNVQKVFSRWSLARFKKPVPIRGVMAHPVPAPADAIRLPSKNERSAKELFPDLRQTANLKVNGLFERLLENLAYRHVIVNNPGAILAAPFLDQLGVVEALHTYGPLSFRSSEITNNIIVNTLRIIAGFPTIYDFTQNSDRSVAIGAGLALAPRRSRFYDSLDELRFEHLQKLRNDAAIRARELNIIDGTMIAIDYHCDPSDSRFPGDKQFSRAPDKNGDMVYAHRPHIIWDSMKNTIINIAYCEGRSRAPTALYKFCEDNLFRIIDPKALAEIYADSEYTGEKQLVYLMVRTSADITMCLKQNPKIKKWRDQTVKAGNWQSYGEDYRIASMDFLLAETGKPFRFVVKQRVETNEIRCFGSTHVDHSPTQILDAYHIRWPVETGIKDLIESYFLNHPTGTSPEKVETHYYCVMLARLTIDYFRSIVCFPGWRQPGDWQCVLSTIRTTLFSSQNCELSLHESGDLLLTYLDGDPMGIKRHLATVLDKRKEVCLNRVSWWGNRGVRVAVRDQFARSDQPSGPEIAPAQWT
jgi:transcriptional regulator with XRE-family HTH domain